VILFSEGLRKRASLKANGISVKKGPVSFISFQKKTRIYAASFSVSGTDKMIS